ncbi:hypothetical protein MAHJHV28_39970 [Mycobacterium avium subsp. hominissuis]
MAWTLRLPRRRLISKGAMRALGGRYRAGQSGAAPPAIQQAGYRDSQAGGSWKKQCVVAEPAANEGARRAAADE